VTGNYLVYEHVFPNGKRYIGITSQTTMMRWRKDGSGYNNQKLIKRAIKKYGWENISHSVLFQGLSQAEARKIETRLIEEDDLINPEKGYNVTPGGDIPPKITRAVYCIEDDIVYQSITEASIGTGIDSHQIQWACAGLRSKITVHGKHWCYDNDRKTIEEIELRRKKTGSKGRPVRCIETGIVYNTGKEATDAIGGREYGAIGSVCKGTYKAKTYKGYHWEYADAIKDDSS